LGVAYYSAPNPTFTPVDEFGGIGKMKKKSNRFLTITLVTIASLLLSFAAAAPVQAAPGLSVDGVKLDIPLTPGQAYTHTMTVTSGADYPMDMIIEASGFGQSLDGIITALPAQDDNSPYTAQPFISNIDILSFHLEPGGSQQVTATINVPVDAEPGTKYAIIYIHSKPGGKTGIGVILATNVLVIIRVPGGQDIKKGEITDLKVPDPEPGKPVQVSTTFKNTGNIHYTIKNQVTITNESGETVAQTETPLSTTSVVPTFSRLSVTAIDSAGTGESLPAGKYYAESGILLDDGTLLDSKKTGFIIAEGLAGAASFKAESETINVSPVGALPLTSTPKPILGHASKGTNWSMIWIIITSIVAAGAVITAVVLTRKRNRATNNESPAE
jgi:hypothetical protein